MLLVAVYISTDHKHYSDKVQEKLQTEVRKPATKGTKVLPCFYEPFLLGRNEIFINTYI